MDIAIPGRGRFDLQHLVLDVNGTIVAGGQLIAGVKERLVALRAAGLGVHCITADTRGRQAALDRELGWPAVRIKAHAPQGEAAQKAEFVSTLGAEQVIAIGNGANDRDMLRQAALGIAVLGVEGLALDTFLAADVVAPDILAALDLLLEPARLVATLRQ